MAEDAAAYAHPITASDDARRGVGMTPNPSAAATAAATEAISGGHPTDCATAAPTVAALASTSPRKTTRRMIR